MSEWRHYKDLSWAGGGKTVCMECRFAFADGAYHHVDEWRYCPMCGAEMEGKAEMIDLFGQSVDDFQRKQTNTDNKKRAWENAFQRWSDKESRNGTTHNGKCGYGRICDYCTDNHIGRPCVRALNAMAREKHINIDYNDRDFKRWF